MPEEFEFKGVTPTRLNPNIKEEFSKNIEEIIKLGAKMMWALAKWAKETDNLQSWQRGIVGSVASGLGKDRKPSEKQAVQVIKALKEAKKLGFEFEE